MLQFKTMGICDECIIKDGCKFADSGLIMKHCKNFIGEAPREIKTNFQCITSSPESLAEFIEDVTYKCYGCKVIFADNCPHRKRGLAMFCDTEECAEWLKQESEDENMS